MEVPIWSEKNYLWQKKKLCFTSQVFRMTFRVIFLKGAGYSQCCFHSGERSVHPLAALFSPAMEVAVQLPHVCMLFVLKCFPDQNTIRSIVDKRGPSASSGNFNTVSTIFLPTLKSGGGNCSHSTPSSWHEWVIHWRELGDLTALTVWERNAVALTMHSNRHLSHPTPILSCNLPSREQWFSFV